MNEIREQLIQAIAEVYSFKRTRYENSLCAPRAASVRFVYIGPYTEPKIAALNSMQQDGYFACWDLRIGGLCVWNLSPKFRMILEQENTRKDKENLWHDYQFDFYGNEVKV